MESGRHAGTDRRDDEIMGVRHRAFASTRAPLEGVQFHPESIMTAAGKGMRKNFLAMAGAAVGA